MDMKDRLSEILGLNSKAAAAKRETGNGWSTRDPSPESISEIQISPPVFGPETEARMEQSRGIIPEEAIAAFRRANAYLAVKNYGRAISDYTRAIGHAPKLPEIHYNRGFVHEKAGKFIKAIEDYSNAVDADPQYVKAYCNRASLLWSQGETRQALEDMKKAARLGMREIQVYLRSKGIDW
ncbi:MAG: tetratricopeptide repeat protein [Syntrophaceae bacterium]